MGSTYHRPLRWPSLALAVVIASLLCAAAARASDLVIAGAGFGHGVGMSQEGALGFAERGFSYRAILAHYYTGTRIGQAPAGAPVRLLIAGKVRRIALETYVRGVIAAEVPSNWPAAALQAQAVASRTYALTAHAGGARFDVYADTRSQVYRGTAAHTPQTDAAVAATAGQVITYAGHPAITYFFASSGGRTESVENAFPGSVAEPWLRGVLDPYERGSTHSWKLTVSFAAAGARLRGLVRGSFRGIEVLRRGVSPRILAAYVLGSAGRALVSGDALAARLGLYDTWAYFSVREGQTTTPEPDRSGQPSALGAPPPEATPSAPQGGVQAAGPAQAPAATAADPAGGTAAPA
jgi:stage II sporulation protein D